jgi:hypothetical protein
LIAARDKNRVTKRRELFGEFVTDAAATVMDPIFWTEKRPLLKWWAALKMKESQCPERVRITRPA